MMVRKRESFQNEEGFDAQMMQKVSEYFARCKGQRQARKKVLPLMLWE